MIDLTEMVAAALGKNTSAHGRVMKLFERQNMKGRLPRNLIGTAILMLNFSVQAQISNEAFSNRSVADPKIDSACPDGKYEGRPSPGRARYVKDPYIWAVTKEFAERFCMPKEFIAEDLKGAEAIAYQHGKPTGQEYCEIKDGQEICAPARYGHWIEIYTKTGEIPKYDAEVKYYRREDINSKNMLGTMSKEKILAEAKLKSQARKRGEILESPGKKNAFRRVGVDDEMNISFNYLARSSPTDFEERSAALIPYFFQEKIYEDIDLIALEAWSWGAIAGQKYPPTSSHGYAIVLARRAVPPQQLKYPEGFLHVIELPNRIVQVINAADRNGGAAFDEAVQRLR